MKRVHPRSMPGLIGAVPDGKAALLEQTPQSAGVEQRPMARDMVAAPPLLLEQSRIPGVEVGRLDDQGAAGTGSATCSMTWNMIARSIEPAGISEQSSTCRR